MVRFQLSERARKFAREVGSIVLGVLIALAIGEVADTVRHRVYAHRALAAIRSDMIDNVSTFDLQPLVDSCARRRLATLSTLLDRARSSGQMPDIGEIGMTRGHSARTGTWESAVANGDVLYLDRGLVGELTDYHQTLAPYRSLQQDATLSWARLAVLTHAPGRIDDNTLSAARQTVAELTYYVGMIDHLAGLLLDGHRSLGFPVEYTPFNGHPTSRAQMRAAILASPLCRPLQVRA